MRWIMKLLVEPTTKVFDDYLSCGIDGFILGLDGYSTSFDLVFSCSEIRDLKEKYPSISLFVSLNKTMFNEDLDGLKNVLLELDKMDLSGILFYDLALLELKKEFGLSTPLVWNQTHMVTNYNTCNYYYKQGVKYAYLASELTLDEMLEIKEKSSIFPMAMVLGYPLMAVSRRSLLTNYSKMASVPFSSSLTVFEKGSNQKFFVEEEESGTSFYQGKLVNGIVPFVSLLEHDFDYGVLKEQYIDHSLFVSLCSSFAKLREDLSRKEEIIRYVNSLIGKYQGFFYQKTIYKVKKHD